MAKKPSKPARPKGPPKAPKQVEALRHSRAKRRNIPPAEMQSAAERQEAAAPAEPAVYKRAAPLAAGETRPRDTDLDPQIIWRGARIRLSPAQIETLNQTGAVDIGEAQLVWRGKDTQDWTDLIVQAPPIYIQEKIHPKVIIEDLKKRAAETRRAEGAEAPNMFADFNGLDPESAAEFYQHEQNWQNRMILGDSLQVMASMAEREQLRGQVQCIYFDPPYGIKFNSNWQVSTRSRDVKDGKHEHITREPEQVKAFRDTWKNGIHSYLTYLRDRLTVMRDMLTESGSIFVQIGDENVHRVRALMDEVFGEENFFSEIVFKKTAGLSKGGVSGVIDYILWYAKSKPEMRLNRIYEPKPEFGDGAYSYLRLSNLSARRMSKDEKAGVVPIPDGSGIYRQQIALAAGLTPSCVFQIQFEGKTFDPKKGASWKSNANGMSRLILANRIQASGSGLSYIRFINDFPVTPINNFWSGTASGSGMGKIYVVQTNAEVVQRCILMATDPGDLVFDPTCGSGTTAYVAEQWGRRWITADTSRVALALARTRLMAARYPYYHLADSAEGRAVEQNASGQIQPDTPTAGDIRQGFVYERAPHVTLKSIANNAEIDVIYENYQAKLEPLRAALNKAAGEAWEEYEIPREPVAGWNEQAKTAHAAWWEQRIARQREIDGSIAQKADVELLYDRPYEDKSRVRVAGPFTVESLSPHRVIPGDDAELIDDIDAAEGRRARVDAPGQDFTSVVLENLKAAGVHQSDKQDRIEFSAVEGWPGEYIAAFGVYEQDGAPKRAAVFIGPEFGAVQRPDIMAAAREANDARFDVLIACGFNFDAHSSDINKLGPLPILKAKMNPDLHMADNLKTTGAGNLFVVFGEPDIQWSADDAGDITVEVLGVDVFDPKTGQVRASGKDDIAAWFIDTDYNEESFFVRHAYFLGANDPYKALRTSLKAEIDEAAWASLYSDTSRPFPRPDSGRFAVKVINHFGDEVMKVFQV